MNNNVSVITDSDEEVEDNDIINRVKRIFKEDSYFKTEKNKRCQLKKEIAAIISYDTFIQRFAYYSPIYGILIDFRYFKIFAKPIIYDAIINHCITIFDKSLEQSQKSTFFIHLNLQGLSLFDIESHYSFICKFAEVMKAKYPVHLEGCNLYKAPFIVNQLLRIISLFINKETQKRFNVV
jgi:hypothetical protein